MAATVVGATPSMVADQLTTALRDGAFVVDAANVVRRSNIVLGRANTEPTESMPLGNGVLGVAAWAAKGFTAQLNRTDTFPDRKSPGQVVIPSLTKLTGAPDFTAHLDLYDAILTETGGGMTARIYVRSDSDELVVDVTGADPNNAQEARIGLPAGRSPQATVSGTVGLLAETWKDDIAAGASGQKFGSLAAITAAGRNVRASVVDAHTVEVKFSPRPDGSFRVVVAAPPWTQWDPAGSDAMRSVALDAARDSREVESTHIAWWRQFWSRVGLIRLSSADGSADYVENLRTIYLYSTAAESRGTLPGSQGGVADLFSFSEDDDHDWYPAGYWIWNLRMQQAANASAGAFDLNAPLYSLYRLNLVNIEQWTPSTCPAVTGFVCRKPCGSTETATTTAPSHQAMHRVTRPLRRRGTHKPSPAAPRSACGFGSSTS
jgi:hypothetical protein